jgi:hypothetical protein
LRTISSTRSARTSASRPCAAIFPQGAAPGSPISSAATTGPSGASAIANSSGFSHCNGPGPRVGHRLRRGIALIDGRFHPLVAVFDLAGNLQRHWRRFGFDTGRSRYRRLGVPPGALWRAAREGSGAIPFPNHRYFRHNWPPWARKAPMAAFSGSLFRPPRDNSPDPNLARAAAIDSNPA